MRFEAELATQLLMAPKTLLPGEWLEQGQGTQITTSVMAKHPCADLVFLTASISHGSANKASFLLQMSVRGYRQRFRIFALDWNPTTPHANGAKENDPDSLRIIPPKQTHTHHFADRLNDENPDGFARPLHDPLPTYEDALNFFCDRINLVRPPHLPAPPLQGLLL